jgi:predicted flap endonuclease-1-like 5' DNA nuclease
MPSAQFPFVDALQAAKGPLEALTSLFDAALSELLPSAAHAGGFGPQGPAQPGLSAEPLFGTQEGKGARAWKLSAPAVKVDAQRVPLIFVEAATPAVAAPAHGLWLSWQKAAVNDGHATYSLVVPRVPGAATEGDACARLADCVKAAGGSGVVIVRFDAASLIHDCASLRQAGVQEVIVGPMPLWPLPTQATGEYPLRTLYTLLGWLDGGILSGAPAAAWQLLGHPMASMSWPGLVQAALWQENTARAALPGDVPAQALASLMGPWLVPGIASVLADDWAIRRAATAAGSSDGSLPLHVLFTAEDTEPARIWAQDYALDLFGAASAEPRISLGVGAALNFVRPARAGRPVTVKPVQETRREPKPATKRVAAKAAPKARAADDLTRIEGIGPKIAGLLQKAGVRTFEDLAQAKPANLQTVLAAAGPRFTLAKPGTWPKQAGMLARGDEKAFAALTERLRGGVAA